MKIIFTIIIGLVFCYGVYLILSTTVKKMKLAKELGLTAPEIKKLIKNKPLSKIGQRFNQLDLKLVYGVIVCTVGTIVVGFICGLMLKLMR